MPIVIEVAANRAADTLKCGHLIQSLVDNLSQRDAKRGIALIALNDAITPKKKCHVLGLFDCSPVLPAKMTPPQPRIRWPRKPISWLGSSSL